MSPRPPSGSSQRVLFPVSKRPAIPLDSDHRLVRLADALDWTQMEQRTQSIRRKKLKSRAGRPPRLRVLLGAMVLMAVRRMTYREVEDQIRYYAPARYLCGLTETEWTPDFTTVQDFTQLMGEDGIRLINEYTVGLAVAQKLADPRLVVADTTAQEAAIPHPNEMGLMASFVRAVTSYGRHAGETFRAMLSRSAGKLRAAKDALRRYRLRASRESKQVKDRMVAGMAAIVDNIRSSLGRALAKAGSTSFRVRGHGITAVRRLASLHATMTKLLPQIDHWLKTGHVATGKIINLQIPELYAIVRGKVGKAVEFGLNWGISRLRGGFLLATVASARCELEDTRFAIRAVQDHIALFGTPPRAYAYDRGGFSHENVTKLKQLGVRDIGLAPTGKAAWPVRGRVRQRLTRERGLIEAGIGSIKCHRYGFNCPAARSAAMMGACGQRAVLGFNLNKLVRGLAERAAVALTG